MRIINNQKKTKNQIFNFVQSIDRQTTPASFDDFHLNFSFFLILFFSFIAFFSFSLLYLITRKKRNILFRFFLNKKKIQVDDGCRAKTVFFRLLFYLFVQANTIFRLWFNAPQKKEKRINWFLFSHLCLLSCLIEWLFKQGNFNVLLCFFSFFTDLFYFSFSSALSFLRFFNYVKNFLGDST